MWEFDVYVGTVVLESQKKYQTHPQDLQGFGAIKCGFWKLKFHCLKSSMSNSPA